MKSKELKIYNYIMLFTFSLIFVLMMFKLFYIKSNSKVYPIEKSTLKTSYIEAKDLDKENLSLQKQNYYEQLWKKK